MKKHLAKISCFLMLMLPSAFFSEDLLGALELALKNDPIYKQAAANALSAQQSVEVAKSSFRPAVNLSASRTGYNRIITKTPTFTGKVDNNVRLNNLNMSQTVFDWPSFMTVKLFQAQDKRAEALYRSAIQDVMVRCARAYFAVLQAEDTLRFTIAQHKANERQLMQARERFRVGLDAITTVDEAKAEFDATIAQEISARNDVQSAKELLRAITGVYIDHLAPVVDNLPLRAPEPKDADYWVNLGIKHNYVLLAAKYGAEAAKRNIGVNLGSNFPVLNLFANVNDNKGSNFGSGSFDIETKNVGVELNFPIVQGGAVVSSTRRAQYDYEAALADVDAQLRTVISRGYQLYNTVMSGIEVVKADRAAVVSRTSSLTSTEAAYKVGTRTIIDVLIEQQNLFDSQRQLASDQYKYLNDFLDLKQNAGTLNIADIEEINSWLKGKTALTTSDRDLEKQRPNKPYPSASNAFILPTPMHMPLVDERHPEEQKQCAGNDANPPSKTPCVQSTTAPVKVALKTEKIATPQVEVLKPQVQVSKPTTAKQAKPKASVAASALQSKNTWLIAGTFKNEDNAKQLAAKLQKMTQKNTVVVPKTMASTTYYQVELGPLAGSKQALADLKAKVEKAGCPSVLVVSRA